MPQIPNKILNKIWTRNEVKSKASSQKSKGNTLVFTNGVFDILHAGHVSYLTDAAALGDFLIVGVNSDDSVKRLGKSPARPLQNETSRSAVIAALECVGAVVVFNEDTPYELIQQVLPDVLVKGADYKPEQIAGADIVLANGGKVLTIKLIEGYSTTSIEQKILKENQ